MDAIGSSTKLMWFFVFIYSFPILLLILSVAIWSYKKFKRFAFISYIADTTLTVLILLGDISNLVSRFIKDTPMYHYGIILKRSITFLADIKRAVFKNVELL